MRVVFATPFYVPDLRFGGPPQKIHSVAQGLIDFGHTVRVLTFQHDDGRADGETKIDRVSVRYLPWRGRGLRQIPLAWDVMRREIVPAQVVHCYGLYTALIPLATQAANRAGVPVVQEPLGMYPPRARNQPAKNLYNRWITRRLFNGAAAIIAASESEAADLKRFVPHANIVHRPNGIDLKAYASLPSGDELRRIWNIPPEKKIVLFIGRISPIKNLEELVQAFARASLTDCHLVMVGPSEPQYEKRLRALVHRENIRATVLLAGPLYDDQQKAALAIADLFVLPSTSESFGNAAAEAVAAGVPVLLTQTCGIAPIIHGRAGLAVPLGVENLAQGLRSMLDPGVRDQMTARSDEVKRELSWDEPIAQTVALYARIIAAKRR